MRQAAEDMRLFEADTTFFALLLGHILAMELLAWLIIYLLGPGWVSSILAALILAISQVTLKTTQQMRGPERVETQDSFFRNERMN